MFTVIFVLSAFFLDFTILAAAGGDKFCGYLSVILATVVIFGMWKFKRSISKQDAEIRRNKFEKAKDYLRSIGYCEQQIASIGER
jgi:hypothetical protein